MVFSQNAGPDFNIHQCNVRLGFTIYVNYRLITVVSSSYYALGILADGLLTLLEHGLRARANMFNSSSTSIIFSCQDSDEVKQLQDQGNLNI